MEQSPQTDRRNALKDLAGKSWNLELIISGAAIVLTTYLPDLVEDMFYYYHYNLSYDWDSSASFLPVLAYAFFKTVAYLMIAMFVAHLVMRAFWVAAVGLQAAFPEGIRYKEIPNLPPSIQQYQEKKLGTLDDYILRLDRLCNQVLAFAFLISLMGISIGVLYNIFFWLAQMTKALLSPAAMAILMPILVIVICGFSVLILILNHRMKTRPEIDARYSKWTIKLYGVINNAFLPFMNRPISYLTLTFVSNIPKRRYYVGMTIVMVLVMSSVFVVLLEKMGDLKSRHVLEFRKYYAAGAPQTELVSDRYDNLRSEPRRVPPVSLSSDIVEGPFLQVFVTYPKMLDNTLTAFCPLSPVPDSLPRNVRMARLDSLRLACLSGFYRVYLNDSLCDRPDWMFHQKPGAMTRGLVAFLPTAGFRHGKNIVTVKVPVESKLDSLKMFGAVPFWFAPK